MTENFNLGKGERKKEAIKILASFFLLIIHLNFLLSILILSLLAPVKWL